MSSHVGPCSSEAGDAFGKVGFWHLHIPHWPGAYPHNIKLILLHTHATARPRSRLRSVHVFKRSAALLLRGARCGSCFTEDAPNVLLQMVRIHNKKLVSLFQALVSGGIVYSIFYMVVDRSYAKFDIVRITTPPRRRPAPSPGDRAPQRPRRARSRTCRSCSATTEATCRTRLRCKLR